MRVYTTEQIRNIALIADHGAGKTSLAEAMVFISGVTDKLGRVDDSTSLLDYETEEKNRKMSINSHIAYLEWKDNFINLIDTPGFSNFLYEAESALQVVDSAIIVHSALSGIKTQTNKFWQMVSNYGIPKVIFLNKLDKESSSIENALHDLKKDLDLTPVLLTIPIGGEDNLTGVIDLVAMNAHLYDDTGTSTIEDIPDKYLEESNSYREKIIESIAELDDELLEKYLEGESISDETVYKMLKQGISESRFAPVFAGSAIKLLGINIILDSICSFLPSPLERPSIKVLNNDEPVEINPQDLNSTLALVFKTISDPYAGKISLLRIFSGSIIKDSTIYNSSKNSKEKIGQLFRIVGKKQTPVDSCRAGDIISVNKLKDVETGDTITADSNQFIIPTIRVPQAVMSYAIEPKSRPDEDKLMPSLHRIHEEDPSINFKIEDETKEFLISGTGQTHIEVIVDKLKNKYGVSVELKTPKVPYRETINGSSKAEGKYIKQTGGRGQYGDAWIEIEPLPRGKEFEFVDKIVGGAIPKNFIPSVEKGIKEALKKGVLARYPVMGVKATLFDGKYHSVDSSDIAFQIAGSIAFKKAMEQAKPVLLEPIMRMEINAPEDCIGDVIGDINARRGKVSGIDPQPGIHVIKALVPMAEILMYAPELRSITSGRGSFTMEFSAYEEVPSHIAKKIIEEEKRDKESEG